MARPSGKSQRIRERYFKSTPIFKASEGKYSPLPWPLRRVQWLFQVREWQVLTYLMMRAGPDSLCWHTDKEIAYDLGIGPKKLPPYIKSLERNGFIQIVEGEGRRYICVIDPLTAIRELARQGRFNDERLQALNEDVVEMMKLPAVEGPPPPNVTTLHAPSRGARATKG